MTSGTSFIINKLTASCSLATQSENTHWFSFIALVRLQRIGWYSWTELNSLQKNFTIRSLLLIHYVRWTFSILSTYSTSNCPVRVDCLQQLYLQRSTNKSPMYIGRYQQSSSDLLPCQRRFYTEGRIFHATCNESVIKWFHLSPQAKKNSESCMPNCDKFRILLNINKLAWIIINISHPCIRCSHFDLWNRSFPS